MQDKVHGIEVSPDGTMVAVACDNRAIYVWDFESGDMIKALTEHDWVRTQMGYANAITFGLVIWILTYFSYFAPSTRSVVRRVLVRTGGDSLQRAGAAKFAFVVATVVIFPAHVVFPPG